MLKINYDNLNWILIGDCHFFCMKILYFASIVVVFFSTGLLVDAQYLDISQLTAEKFPVIAENKTFIVYYGYAGDFEGEISPTDVKKPKIQSLDIDLERKSLIIEIDHAQESDFMWIRIPRELLSAGENNFEIFVNDLKQEYDLVSYESDVRVGFLINEGSTKIEIIGTKVIPEFASMIILLGGSVFLSILISYRLKNNFKVF